jgi:hypothetical protein
LLPRHGTSSFRSNFAVCQEEHDSELTKDNIRVELVREDAPHFALRDVTFLRTVLFCTIICHHEALTGAHCPSLSSPFHDNL